MDSLLVGCAQIATGKNFLSSLEVSSSLCWCFWSSLSEVIPVLSAEVTGFLSSIVSWNDCAKALGCGMHGSVYEGKLSDIVLVNHAQNWLLFTNMHLWVLNFLGVCGFKFSKAIVTDQMLSFLFGFAIEGT